MKLKDYLKECEQEGIIITTHFAMNPQELAELEVEDKELHNLIFQFDTASLALENYVSQLIDKTEKAEKENV